MAAPPRTMRSVVYHPRGTMHLALQSVVDRLALECEQGAVAPLTQSLVARIAAHAVGASVAGESVVWSWRVVATTVRDPAAPSRVLYDAGHVSGAV